LETVLDIVVKVFGLLVPIAFIVILVIVVRKIMNTPDAPLYDLPANLAGSSKFDGTARRAASLELPDKLKESAYIELHLEGRGPSGRGLDGEGAADLASLVYCTAYELMMRGLAAKLMEMELFRDSPGTRPSAQSPVTTYTTQALSQHAGEVASITDFAKFVPWRDGGLVVIAGTRYDYHLFVWKDHLDRAFDVLRELNVPLSYAWHPKQAWWRDQRYVKPPP
jgi:hypothetical protein